MGVVHCKRTVLKGFMEGNGIGRVRILIYLGIVLSLFLVVNSPDFFKASIVYIIFLLVAFVLFRKGSYFFGVDKDYFLDISWGIGYSAMFIVPSLLGSSIAIGIPDLPQSLAATSRFLIIVLLAPIAEELIFRGAVQGYMIKGLKWNLWLAIVIQAVIFSLFHIAAYGSFALQSGAFIGALLFGLGAGFLVYKTNSLLSSITAHVLFNGFLYANLVVAIG